MNEEKTLYEEEITQDVEDIITEDQGSDIVEETEITDITEEPQSEDIVETEQNTDITEDEQIADIDEGEQSEDTVESENVTDDIVEIPEESEIFPKESSQPKSKNLPYHERYYLKYRDGKRNAVLDLEGTKSFLQKIGFDGGELKQAREEKNSSESFQNTESNNKNQMYCSYCGAEISGVEFFRLPDGRLRCNTCSNTIVQSKAEVDAMCQRVLANMDSFFGATIDVDVAIEVTEHRKLKKRIGVPLGTQDSQSILILGVAINKRKKYSIVLENGAPNISLIATFAHELTHIWQYTHWDNNTALKKCPKEKRLLIYEGMAKWAEIQYLYLVGETNVARREEFITRKREDEYGIGFRMYEDRYPLTREAMSCEETPFTPDGYPLD